MPGLQFQNLPANRSKYEEQFDQVRQDLNASWQIEADALNRTWFRTKGQFDTALAKLNANYQQKELAARQKIDAAIKEEQQVQQLIKRGIQGISRKEEATLRLQLGPEAERLVFPPSVSAAPYSIPAITSKAVMESIQDFAEAAPTATKFWTRRTKEPKTQQGLINQYFEWRRLIQYDAVNPIRQRQLDMQWDAFMAGDERFDKWWSNKEKREPIVEIKALRTPGEMGKIMRGRLGVTGRTTPFGRSIAKEKPRGHWFGFPGGPPPPAPVTKPTPPSTETLRRTGTQEAYEEGIRLGYWK